MYLKALEMQGFKSFPDKTVLTFDTGMTAVVGPNGSGKSNISDAVMWVLGEQSVKSLRSAKMEDVIFSGTEKRRPMGYAEVTLRLDNQDRGFAYDADEVAVSRRYYRSGESEYKINGKPARLKDIHELFMDTGLGRDGYSMVGQGRIESIVSAKSTDRREIFEEAAGISHYRYRRGDAMKRLEQAEENLVRLRDIAGELESRLEPLAKQSEKAQKFLALSGQRKELEIGLWLHTLERSGELLRRQNEKLDITQNQYDAAVQELDDIFARSRALSEQSRDITLAIEQLQRGAAAEEQSARDVEAEIGLQNTRIAHNQDGIRRVEQDMTAEQEIARSLAENMQKAKDNLRLLEQETETLQAEIQQNEQAISALTAEENILQTSLLEKGAAAAALEKELAAHKIASTSAESAIREINDRLANIHKESENRRAEVKQYEQEQATCQAKLEQLRQAFADAQNALNGCGMKVQLRQKKLEEAKKKVEQSSARLSSLLSRQKMLEETERNMDGYQGSVKAVVREAEKGNLTGIHGPVSRLLSVEDKYAQAVETALGAAVQNIVTASDTDAKRAMVFLKNTNGGRATFLPLSAIRPRYLEEKGLETCVGFEAIASDIVSYDAAYQPVVGYLLGRTVIADSIDNAVAIARKYSHRFKIVTLDGQVIHAGGSMTGGSGLRTSGFMTRRGEIEKAARLAEQQRQENERLLASVRELESETARVVAEQEGLQAELFQVREQMVQQEGQLQIAASALQSAKSAVESFAAEQEKAKARLTAFDRDTGQIAGQIERLEKQAAALSAETAALEEKRQTVRGKKEQLTAATAQLQVTLAEKTTEKTAKTDAISGYMRRSSGHQEKMDALLREKQELEKENEELLRNIAQKQQQVETLREAGKRLLAQIDEKVKQREDCEQKSGELRLFERQKNDEKENLAAELVRLEEKKASLLREREETEKKLFEEYNLSRQEARALGITIESISDATGKLAEIRRKIKALGQVNVGAVDEYKEVSERYAFLRDQMQDVEKSKAELLRLIQDLTERMSEQFRERFAQIQTAFSQTFAELFEGGKGELIADDESNILECGIEIKAQPPGKNVKSISLLSGGEKGLCAIALLFAILKVNPAPFCIFDEVEAALDDVNVTRFAQYVRSMTGRTQFILITHRRGSMEAADILYGVTMQEHGVSKLLELRTADMARQLGLE